MTEIFGGEDERLLFGAGATLLGGRGRAIQDRFVNFWKGLSKVVGETVCLRGPYCVPLLLVSDFTQYPLFTPVFTHHRSSN